MPASWTMAGRSHHRLCPYWSSFKANFLGCLGTFVPTLEKTNIMKKTSFLTQKGEYWVPYSGKFS